MGGNERERRSIISEILPLIALTRKFEEKIYCTDEFISSLDSSGS